MKDRIKKILSPALAISYIIMIFASSVHASPIYPTREIILNNDVLTLGDVFEGVTKNEDHILAPAPAIGKTTILSSYDLQRIANAFNLDWKPQSRFERSVIRRDASYVAKNDIVGYLRTALVKKMQGQKYEIELADRYKKIKIPSKEQPKITVNNLRFDSRTEIFQAEVLLELSDDKKIHNITGKAYQMVEIPVLSNRLRKGDIIEAEDIKFISMRLNDVIANTIINETKLIGKTPRRYIDAMHSIQPEDIRAPIIVKKGERVTLSINNGILNLSTIGKALENGAKGEIVRVVNTNSNRIIEGMVTGHQQIKIISNNASIGTL